MIAGRISLGSGGIREVGILGREALREKCEEQ
jgi:hypothetical protein